MTKHKRNKAKKNTGLATGAIYMTPLSPIDVNDVIREVISYDIDKQIECLSYVYEEELNKDLEMFIQTYIGDIGNIKEYPVSQLISIIQMEDLVEVLLRNTNENRLINKQKQYVDSKTALKLLGFYSDTGQTI